MAVNDFSALLETAYSKRSGLLELTDAFRVVNGLDDGFPGVAIAGTQNCIRGPESFFA